MYVDVDLTRVDCGILEKLLLDVMPERCVGFHVGLPANRTSAHPAFVRAPRCAQHRHHWRELVDTDQAAASALRDSAIVRSKPVGLGAAGIARAHPHGRLSGMPPS
ncbi:hypothetical protein [Burkholderia stagnalis]|uniref:hypothetical protein n=1 Tax=Burkholderia stagnalis TaxID=1503054 RepID=UPI000F570858|nr:hypothetical protein [Burkholderia stagnalis]